MKHSENFDPKRRLLITKTIPACALTLLGLNKLRGGSTENGRYCQQDVHKFDRIDGREFTHRQVGAMQSFLGIMILKELEEEMGKAEVIRFLKKFSTKINLQRGKAQAERATDLNLQSYVSQFKNSEIFKNLLTFDIIHDTDKAFEIKVTECLPAETYRSQNAADIGYAAICWGDYAWAQGFNPKIKLVRDKTLMQGDAFCNHRYIWTG